jgi:hypothetical protein
VGKLFDDWLPTHPLRWVVVFAGFYTVFYLINSAFSSVFDVVPGRVSLIFLPAFIRIVSILIAGVAGLVGVAIGTFAVAVFVNQDPVDSALWISIASSIGIALSYLVLRYAVNGRPLAFTLPVLMVLATMYCAFNALLHGLAWELVGIPVAITIKDLSLMMLGDFMGVIVMFYALRLVLRLIKTVKLFAARQ